MLSQSTKQLGPLLKSWTPGKLLRDVWAGKNLPFWFMPIQTAFVFVSLFLCALGAKQAYTNFLQPMNLSPGIFWGGLAFLVLFAPPMLLLHWLGQMLVNRNELAIHENGIRWSKTCVLFDQIESLSVGTETFHEKHFPTLNVLRKSHWRHGDGVKKAEELEKATTLAFHCKDGTITQWRNFTQCFGSATLDGFFAELGERIDV